MQEADIDIKTRDWRFTHTFTRTQWLCMWLGLMAVGIAMGYFVVTQTGSG